ncbi:MAG TPA: hypothetical protein VLF94_04410 [Chlamydiales bacterium]|nr:hypothetical protein [Chlamydiales bacterium]
MAAAASRSSSRDSLAQQIQALAMSSITEKEREEKIFVFGELQAKIPAYIKQIDLKDPRCRFFAFQLKTLGNFKPKGTECTIETCAKKILSTLRQLTQAQKNPTEVKEKLDYETFEKALTETMESGWKEGDLDLLLVPHLMKKLPKEKIDKLLEYADEREDFQLASFLIEHNLIPEKLDTVIKNAIEANCFHEIAVACRKVGKFVKMHHSNS